MHDGEQRVQSCVKEEVKENGGEDEGQRSKSTRREDAGT